MRVSVHCRHAHATSGALSQREKQLPLVRGSAPNPCHSKTGSGTPYTGKARRQAPHARSRQQNSSRGFGAQAFMALDSPRGEVWRCPPGQGQVRQTLATCPTDAELKDDLKEQLLLEGSLAMVTSLLQTVQIIWASMSPMQQQLLGSHCI